MHLPLHTWRKAFCSSDSSLLGPKIARRRAASSPVRPWSSHCKRVKTSPSWTVSRSTFSLSYRSSALSSIWERAYTAVSDSDGWGNRMGLAEITRNTGRSGAVMGTVRRRRHEPSYASLYGTEQVRALAEKSRPVRGGITSTTYGMTAPWAWRRNVQGSIGEGSCLGGSCSDRLTNGPDEIRPSQTIPSARWAN